MDLFTIAAAKKLAGSGGGTGSTGENGGYYTPSISENGILTWTPSKSDMPSISGSDLSSIGNVEFVTCNLATDSEGNFIPENFSHTFAEIEMAIKNGRYIRLKSTLASGEIVFGEIISYNSNFMAFAVLAKMNIGKGLNWYVGRLSVNNLNTYTLIFEQLYTTSNFNISNYYTAKQIDEKLGNIDEILDNIITEQETIIGGAK